MKMTLTNNRYTNNSILPELINLLTACSWNEFFYRTLFIIFISHRKNNQRMLWQRK